MATLHKRNTNGAFAPLLENPVFLKAFISRTETKIREEKEQLQKEHDSHNREMEKLTIFERPLNASFWMNKYNEILRMEKQLEAAKARLQELEK